MDQIIKLADYLKALGLSIEELTFDQAVALNADLKKQIIELMQLKKSTNNGGE
jgi:hypothetical protein